MHKKAYNWVKELPTLWKTFAGLILTTAALVGLMYKPIHWVEATESRISTIESHQQQFNYRLRLGYLYDEKHALEKDFGKDCANAPESVRKYYDEVVNEIKYIRDEMNRLYNRKY